MMTYMFFFLLYGLLFFFSSLHVIIILLLVEFLVIISVICLLFGSYSWFTMLMVIFFSVCVGCYGVSVLLANSRSKGGSYVMFFI